MWHDIKKHIDLKKTAMSDIMQIEIVKVTST